MKTSFPGVFIFLNKNAYCYALLYVEDILVF